jgi:hypothetical protein
LFILSHKTEPYRFYLDDGSVAVTLLSLVISKPENTFLYSPHSKKVKD